MAVAAVYLDHVLVSWPNQPMENVNQLAMIGVYLLVGAVAGRLVERERRAQREVVLQGIASLSNALGFRDEYTREHCEHVSRLAVEIGKRRGLSGEKLEALRLAALMHDVGKIGVRDDILLKPDHLTPEERARIERHPALAAEILRPIHGAGTIADIVLAHHECPDGSGYPRGLSGNQIPIEARILRVADVFSALTDARAYKPPMRGEDALQHMLSMGADKLDLESVGALRSLLDESMPAGRRAGRGVSGMWRWWAAVFLMLVSPAGCAHFSPGSAEARASRYLTGHPETPPEIAKGIREFRIVLGMDQDQVIAAAGEPDIRSRFGGVRHPEVWLYRVARIGQDLPRSHGASFFRIVFADGRVSFIEPV